MTRRTFSPVVSWAQLQAWVQKHPARGNGRRKLRDSPGRREVREAVEEASQAVEPARGLQEVPMR